MTDVVASARNARECLARGLGTLQSPGVPEHLMAVAEPIARAMTNLHRIESTSGQALGEAAPVALVAARSALSLLQHAKITHPAVDETMEAVAGSLGIVFGLAQDAARAPSPLPLAQTAVVAPAPVTAPAPSPPPLAQTAVVAPAPVTARAPSPPPLAQTAVVVPAPAPSPLVSTVAIAPKAASSGVVASEMAAAVGLGTAPTQPEADALVGGAELQRLEASLGAHSPTNFYKGLSGNDVVDSGGLFIATYQSLPVGTPLALHVALPGGYEFHAKAVVRWTREASSSSDGASPGFGVEFTQISPEGRQLVHRYVRNREPLFHDDL